MISYLSNVNTNYFKRKKRKIKQVLRRKQKAKKEKAPPKNKLTNLTYLILR